MTIIRATIAVADLFSFYRGVFSIILANALQSYDLAVYSHLIKMKSTFNRAVPMGYDQILTLIYGKCKKIRPGPSYPKKSDSIQLRMQFERDFQSN